MKITSTFSIFVAILTFVTSRKTGNKDNGKHLSLGGSKGCPSTLPSGPLVADNHSLQELYQAALAEGGKLILQTLQDFDRWKAQGVLHPYKPIGWDQVYPEFKDPDGYSTGVHIWAFSNNINRDLLGNNENNWPTEASDYLDPKFKGKIISTYPNDDDAVLFMYKLIIDKYGWNWLAKFVKNRPVFVRSTQVPADSLRNGTFPASFTTAGPLRPEVTRPVQFVLPQSDPFVTWAQRAAILKGTRRLAAAKLYLSWWLDVDTQNDWFQWSVRKDVPVPKGFKSVFEYPGQTDPVAFEKFMADRTALEIFKNQVQLYVGEVQGILPTGDLSILQDKMLPAAFA
ncbi:Iron-utilization periplasmic protein [Folsomia candida]|uniref:Iron-utilization periplasmic protein n=1 Tax=Folsomia candida TaxID=158441 RepID=A0A226ER17_FOLCA|nr:Iron-utilization periplasmic protein [Folsomia candida]